MEIIEQFNLQHLNTFRVTAHAGYFAEITGVDQLKEALAFARERNLPYMLIGQGSNLLFREDYPGLIIELNIRGREVIRETAEHATVTARCGEIWHDFVLWTLEQGFFGLENLSLIPGTVGAAPVQNIGAYGVELGDFLEEVQVLDTDSGRLATFSNADCRFGYRDSIFKHQAGKRYVICSVTLKLLKQPRLNLTYPSLKAELEHLAEADITPQLVSDTVSRIRQSKLPDPKTIGNAGSFFWNPVIPRARFDQLQRDFPGIVGYAAGNGVKVPAAWLIEQAGWKAWREGDVGVHDEHALVLVNHGSATGRELYDLAMKIQASVKAKFGIELEPEVRII